LHKDIGAALDILYHSSEQLALHLRNPGCSLTVSLLAAAAVYPLVTDTIETDGCSGVVSRGSELSVDSVEVKLSRTGKLQRNTTSMSINAVAHVLEDDAWHIRSDMFAL